MKVGRLRLIFTLRHARASPIRPWPIAASLIMRKRAKGSSTGACVLFLLAFRLNRQRKQGPTCFPAAARSPPKNHNKTATATDSANPMPAMKRVVSLWILKFPLRSCRRDCAFLVSERNSERRLRAYFCNW